MQERKPDQVQPGLTLDYAAILPRPAAFIEDRQLHPVDAVAKTVAPHDVLDRERAAVFEMRSSIVYTNNACGTRYAGRRELARLDANQRATVQDEVRLGFAAQRRVDRQQPMEHDSEDDRNRYASGERRVRLEGNLAWMTPGQQDLVSHDQVHRNFGARVAGSNEQDAARFELRRILVVLRVNLADRRVEVGGER